MAFEPWSSGEGPSWLLAMRWGMGSRWDSRMKPCVAVFQSAKGSKECRVEVIAVCSAGGNNAMLLTQVVSREYSFRAQGGRCIECGVHFSMNGFMCMQALICTRPRAAAAWNFGLKIPATAAATATAIAASCFQGQGPRPQLPG